MTGSFEGSGAGNRTLRTTLGVLGSWGFASLTLAQCGNYYQTLLSEEPLIMSQNFSV